MTQPFTYKDAGVDIDAGEALVENIKPFVKKTMRPEVLGGLGGFGALFELSQNYRNPVLVSGTDGVGTKLKLAIEWNKHDTVGIDLVAMSVNDVLVQGAEPLFFLDYFACGKLDVETATKVVSGVAKGCELSGCSLIGGETAEMPGMYPEGEYDLAGFAVGAVEKEEIISGANIEEGDVILGLASSGLHSNGYSLVRKVIAASDIDPDAPFDGDRSFKDVVLEPTRLYARSVLSLLNEVPVKGMAHITGGGLVENIPRVIPDGLKATIYQESWEMPKIFRWLQEKGSIPENEMYRTFNCGIGYVIILRQSEAKRARELLEKLGETVYPLGHIEKIRIPNEHKTQVTRFQSEEKSFWDKILDLFK